MSYSKAERPHKKQYQQQLARGEHEKRMERQKLRRKVDKNGKDANGNGVADKREGKDLAHKKPLSKGVGRSCGWSVRKWPVSVIYRVASNP